MYEARRRLSPRLERKKKKKAQSSPGLGRSRITRSRPRRRRDTQYYYSGRFELIFVLFFFFLNSFRRILKPGSVYHRSAVTKNYKIRFWILLAYDSGAGGRRG